MTGKARGKEEEEDVHCFIALLQKRDVTCTCCTRKKLNCTAHADVDQSDGSKLKANQTMIEHTPHSIQLYYIDQWLTPHCFT